MITLSSLKPTPGSRRRKKRVGCGEGSGHGKTSGRGHKGQKARSGGSIRLGFEGGQMPLLRRIPKRGYNSTDFKKVWGLVNLRELANVPAGTVVDEVYLRDNNLVTGFVDGVKILAVGELKSAISVKVDAISDAARAKIEQAGGKVELTGKFSDAK